MDAHEQLEQIEDQLVRLREAVAFAWQFANEHGQGFNEGMYSKCVDGIDKALETLGWVRVGLSEASYFDVDSIPVDAGKAAYEKWFSMAEGEPE
ncbi:hypothetical protein [Oceanithermus sp.]|uniref:hypothetical protein n=1 Tax=Oceanithermus sp. TaxID=2268145 RepID=UPI00257F977D|nr:hypothetical protein [Oceanithermus sp.]